MSFLRFLMLLALVLWVGGLAFFAFVMAPGAFAVLPSRQLAGAVVARTLPELHWMAMVAGMVFLVASAICNRMMTGSARIFSAAHLVIVVMLGLTLILQFGFIPRMDALRTAMGPMDTLSLSDPARMQFDALHVWSTRLESAVFIFGLLVVYLTARPASWERMR